MPLDSDSYRHLLALRDEAARLLASAQADMGPLPTAGDFKALRRIRAVAERFDRHVRQLERTLPSQPLPTEVPSAPHP